MQGDLSNHYYLKLKVEAYFQSIDCDETITVSVKEIEGFQQITFTSLIKLNFGPIGRFELKLNIVGRRSWLGLIS